MAHNKNHLGICNISGCEKKAVAIFLCSKHWLQSKKNGTLNFYEKFQTKKCTVKNCNKKHYAKGFCQNHYRKEKRKKEK